MAEARSDREEVRASDTELGGSAPHFFRLQADLLEYDAAGAPESGASGSYRHAPPFPN